MLNVVLNVRLATDRGAAPGVDGGEPRQRGDEEDRPVQAAARDPGEPRRGRGPRVADEGARQGRQDRQDLGEERRPPGALPLPREFFFSPFLYILLLKRFTNFPRRPLDGSATKAH